MQKEQAEKIAEMIANDIHLTYDPYYSPVFKEKIVNILLTATSVKVPSEKVIGVHSREYERNSWRGDNPIEPRLCLAFTAGAKWAIKRMQEDKV